MATLLSLKQYYQPKNDFKQLNIQTGSKNKFFHHKQDAVRKFNFSLILKAFTKPKSQKIRNVNRTNKY